MWKKRETEINFKLILEDKKNNTKFVGLLFMYRTL